LIHTPNLELKAAAEAYQKLYNKDIISDVADDTSGDFKSLLVGILAASRSEAAIDPALAISDADELYRQGEGRLGTNETFFVEFFLQRSRLHIIEVNRLYVEKRGHDLVAAINSEFSGNLKVALKGLATPRNQYWAARTHSALAGIGTDDRALIRAFVLNDRAQLKEVEAAYSARIDKKQSGQKNPKSKNEEPPKQKEALNKPVSNSLAEGVKADTSGWYQKTLLSLLN
jgi:annexin A7/11